MSAYTDALAEAKAKISLSELIGRDIAVKGTGKNKVCNCPFHDDKSPSLYIDDSKELYNCFGCPAGGDHLSFIMEFKGLSFKEAVEEICEITSTPIPKPESYDKDRAKLSARYFKVAEKAFSILAEGSVNSRSLPISEPLHEKLDVARLMTSKKQNIIRLLKSQWHEELGLSKLVADDGRDLLQTNGVYIPIKTLKDGIAGALFINLDYSHQVINIHPTHKPDDLVINARSVDRKQTVYVAFDAASMVSVNKNTGIDNILLLPHDDGIISAQQFRTCKTEARNHHDLVFLISANRRTHATSLYHLLAHYSAEYPIQLQTLEGVASGAKPRFLLDHIQMAWPNLEPKTQGKFKDQLNAQGLGGIATLFEHESKRANEAKGNLAAGR